MTTASSSTQDWKEKSVFDATKVVNWLPMVLVIKVDNVYECLYINISR